MGVSKKGILVILSAPDGEDKITNIPFFEAPILSKH